MNVLFPSDPLNPKVVDSSFLLELEAAFKNKFACALIDLAALESGQVKLHRTMTEGVTFYRGWMMSPTQYTHLAKEMWARGTPLCNNADYYDLTYNFPRWYERVKEFTPESFWIGQEKLTDTQTIAETVAETCMQFPQVLKDYLKSQKHYWHEACFIPDPSDVAATKRVIDRFIELQGSSFVGGLVFREHEEFVSLGRTHEASKFPLIDEYRAFLRHGHIITIRHMWDQDGVPSEEDSHPGHFLEKLGRHQLADIPFLAVDVARTKDNDFRIVELGDGGTSSLPSPDDLDSFYAALARSAESYPRTRFR